jgi:hypothetical protein
MLLSLATLISGVVSGITITSYIKLHTDTGKMPRLLSDSVGRVSGLHLYLSEYCTIQLTFDVLLCLQPANAESVAITPSGIILGQGGQQLQVLSFFVHGRQVQQFAQ